MREQGGAEDQEVVESDHSALTSASGSGTVSGPLASRWRSAIAGTLAAPGSRQVVLPGDHHGADERDREREPGDLERQRVAREQDRRDRSGVVGVRGRDLPIRARHDEADRQRERRGHDAGRPIAGRACGFSTSSARGPASISANITSTVMAPP